MRRSIATLLFPLAALSACATAGSDGINTSLRPGFEGGGVVSSAHALRVRLSDAGGSLGVQLNRPAHVAVFQVVPGEGVALVSRPLPGGMVPSGFSTVVTHFELNRYWRYDDVASRRSVSYGPFGAYSGSGVSHFALAGGGGPRHLMVVASERPLRVGRFETSRGSLRRVMGTARYTSQSSRHVMDDLLATVLEDQPEGSWDADVLTVWPQGDDLRVPNGQLYRVRCRSGAVVWAPLELINAACRDPERVAPPTVRPDSARPRDTADVREPSTRRPVPAAAEGADARPIRMADFAGDDQRGFRLRPVPDASGERMVRLSELREELRERRTRRNEGGEDSQWRPGSARIEHMPTAERLTRPSGESAGRTTDVPHFERPAAAAAGSTESARPPRIERERPQAPPRGEGGRSGSEP